MHFGNGQAATPRKDGASSPPALGLRICPLFLLCAGLLLGLGSGAAGLCQPCPGNCTCASSSSSLPDPAASCLVNCSAQGLLEAGSVPANATILDLSSNNITTLDKVLFEPLHDLQLEASNHVSNANLNYKVTSEKMVPMRDLELGASFPSVWMQDSILELSSSILVDLAVEATYSWSFGDGNGTNQEYHYQPPYNKSFPVPYPKVPQVYIQSIVTHTYKEPGTYNITVSVYNKYENVSITIPMQIQTILANLRIKTYPEVLVLGCPSIFEAKVEPSDFGVSYTWDFGDGSGQLRVNETSVNHTFYDLGIYTVSLTAGNDLSEINCTRVFGVHENITGLMISSDEPTERGLQTFINASVETGDNITWTFSMGDGILHTTKEPMVNHTYSKDGNYTVTVTASNAVSTTFMSLLVRVYVLQVLKIEPSSCILENSNVTLTAYVTGDYERYTFNWTFGNGSSMISVYGVPSVKYNFSTSGIYPLSLVLSSQGNKAYYFTNICVEVFAVANNTLGLVNSTITVFVQEPIEDVSITTIDHKSDHVPTGTIMCLIGSVQRGSNVSWSWTLPEGTKEGNMQTVHFYQAGVFSISLNASNNVSWEATSLNITVQDKIEGLKLQVSKMVVEPGERVTFTIILSAGTSVTYNLTINGEFYIQLNSTTYTHEFTKIGGYLVTVVASNNISEKRSTVMIPVLEAIKNLNIINCCEIAVPDRIEKSFIAEVSNGSLVAYTWQFDLQGQPTISLAGKKVTYTPVAAGLLKIHLSASNDLGSENITKIIKVQEIIVGLTLEPVNAYVNRCVTFKVVVRPSPSEVIFRWMFGDSSPIVVTHSTSAEHSYHEPGDYLVVVNASNLISFWTAQILVTTRVLECEEPVVQLALPSQVIMRRSQRNYIEAQINLRGCISYQTEHRWTIYKASNCLQYQESPKVHLQNVDATRPQLVIPKLALEIGDYCFEFSVSFGNTPLSRSSLANVTMAPSKLVPIIDGGTYRVWSNSRDLVLDGGKSYDPNLEENDQTRLDYKWTCTQGSESNGFCSDFAPEFGIVTIPKSVLEAGVEFTFYLSISKTGRPSESTNQTVLIKKGSLPIVSLKCVSCKAQSVYEVSASSYVYLEGSCSNCLDDSRSWRWTAQSFHNKSLTLDLSTTTTGHREMNLVLRQGALMDGEGYKFTLHVSDPTMDEEGFATIDLLPNSPPSGGSCRIFPNKTIHALSTKIQFHCTGWKDAEDEGASLVFSLKVKRCKDLHCDEFWVYKGSRSEHSTFLPVGFHEWNFNVSVSVLVQDQQGAVAEALNHTQVIAMPIIPAGFPTLSNWLRNLTETTLQGLIKQGDPQHVAEYSLALITVLNEHESLMSEQGRTIDPDLGIVRRIITDTLIALKVNTVDDIRQIVAALAQCTVTSKELACAACQRKTLDKLEDMMSILQNETTQGMMMSTTIADNIRNIMATGPPV